MNEKRIKEMLSYEQRLLEWLQHHLIDQGPAIGEGKKLIRVEEVRLEQGQEEGLIVIMFRQDGRPDCRFGFCMPAYEDTASQRNLLDIPDTALWPDDPAIVWGDIVAASLTEQVVAGDRGLPKNCVPDGITWISQLAPQGVWTR